MIIVQISDSHITATGESGNARLANLKSCIGHINTLDRQPDIVIHTGDLSQDNLDVEYQMVMSQMKRLRIPYFVIPGNRDNSATMRALFGDKLPLTTASSHFCYVIDDYPVRVIALDTTSSTSGLGEFCDERAEFLRDALASSVVKPVLIAMHHPPFEVHVSSTPKEFENWKMAERFQEIVEQHPGKIRIICGHVHRNSFGNIGEIATSTIPSVALDLRRKNDPLVIDEEIMYHIHEFGADGNCATRLVRAPMPIKEKGAVENPVPGMAV